MFLITQRYDPPGLVLLVLTTQRCDAAGLVLLVLTTQRCDPPDLVLLVLMTHWRVPPRFIGLGDAVAWPGLPLMVTTAPACPAVPCCGIVVSGGKLSSNHLTSNPTK